MIGGIVVHAIAGGLQIKVMSVGEIYANVFQFMYLRLSSVVLSRDVPEMLSSRVVSPKSGWENIESNPLSTASFTLTNTNTCNVLFDGVSKINVAQVHRVQIQHITVLL